jgi:riboflavin-specific deaminase-like protein
MTSLPAGSPAVDPIALIRDAPGDRPFVVAQLGQSLDGRIALPSGESRWINKEAALDHVHRVRAAVDAVIVGVGTVIADDPLLNVRRVPGRNPARVVIDPNGRVPAAARCLSGGDGVRRVIVCAERPAAVANGVEIVLVKPEGGQLPPGRIIEALWSLGLKRFLVEGGARTVSAFLDAGALDRLHVLVAPVILGSGKPGLTLAPVAKLSAALRPPATVHVLADGDVLFDCDIRSASNRS